MSYQLWFILFALLLLEWTVSRIEKLLEEIRTALQHLVLDARSKD